MAYYNNPNVPQWLIFQVVLRLIEMQIRFCFCGLKIFCERDAVDRSWSHKLSDIEFLSSEVLGSNTSYNSFYCTEKCLALVTYFGHFFGRLLSQRQP